MNALRPPRFSRSLILVLCLVWTALPCPAHAARPGGTLVGLRLLQAQLPAGGSLRKLDCDALVKTAHAATLAHRDQAAQVLVAALSLDEWNAKRKAEDRISCVCVVRLFHACADAAPERAVFLLETTQALYPECADNLTAALRDLESRIRVASNTTTRPSRPESPDGTSTDDGSDGAGSGGTGSGDGTGLGTGPGFPGSPGFGGSNPSGGIALPTPVPVQVTVVVND